MTSIHNGTMALLMKSNGAQRVSTEAAKEMTGAMEEVGAFISKKAIEIAQHADRKTIKSEDVKFARKLVIIQNA